MESIEVIVAHREPTQPVERRVVIAPVNRRVVVAVQVPPAVVKSRQNRDRQRRWHERHHRNRMATDPQYRLRKTLRSQLYDIVKRNRPSGAEALVGCTAEDLIAHLKSTIPEGADVMNYHIDHIRPVASFDLTDEAQQRECFHWTNLQLLTAKENMEKGSRW